MKSSAQDQTEGKFHEVKGKIKEVVGELSDDPDLEAEGTREKIAGKVQKRSVRSRKSLGSSASGISISCTECPWAPVLPIPRLRNKKVK